jgi:hypothetical protein
MKVITLLLSLLFSICLSAAQEKKPEDVKVNRFEKTINSDWTFNYFPSESAGQGYESPGFNDSRWPVISIPHTWNSYMTTRILSPFTRSPAETGETLWWTGWGWYRKHFSISSEIPDHKVFLEFEGVQKYCKVWVNGKLAGDHKGGYGSFDIDITGLIVQGGDNLLAVAVSYLQKDEFRVHPLTEGTQNVSGGIYRNVKIVLKNKMYIPMQGSAAHEGGTFIETPAVSEQEGIVNVKTWVKNDYPEARNCLLQTSVTDGKGQVLQVMKSEAVVNPGQLYMFRQIARPVKNPRLWSVDDPYLYTIRSEVIDKKEVVDTYTSSFGFRCFRIDEKDGSVYLNDRKIDLAGITRHQEYPWLGDAVPAWMTAADFSAMKGNSGYNFIRISKYPGAEIAFRSADETGIITEEDFSGVTAHGFSPDEQQQQVIEMIRRDRNHPGIISWVVSDLPGSQLNSITAATEDSTRQIKSVPARINPFSPDFIYRNEDHPAGSGSATIGEPSGISVKSSPNTLTADKGSVAIVIADVTDSRGNHIPGAKNSIHWKVSGPALLAGPAFYSSYADSNRRADEGWYMEMPATNVIRSSGLPGKITVTAFSAGLASGSCEINCEEPARDNSFISEPDLADAGRKQVIGNPLVTARIEEIPSEITAITEDLSLAAVSKKEFAGEMRDFIKGNNPAIDTSSIEFRTLTNLFAAQLYNNEGALSAADYNFNIDHFNNCRLIAGYIGKTKLPDLYRESLRRYYSDLLIANGNEKIAGDEMNWLNWIPSGGTVVIVTDETMGKVQKGAVFTKLTELQDIINVVYPGFAKFSEEAKDRALIFISKMNPDIQVRYPDNSSADNGKPAGSVSYFVKKGVPLLIPEYKFISE